jgi:hypothetical protein
MHLSLSEECRGRVEQALSALGPEANRDALREMKLHVALGASLANTRGAVHEFGATWTKAREITERIEDADYQLRSLRGLWSFHTASSRHRLALELAERFYALVTKRPDQSDRLLGDRLIGISEHFLGDQPSARRRIEHVLTHYVPPVQKSHIIRFHTAQWVTAQAFLARILWLQGFPEQAMRAAESGIEPARAANHVTSLCNALALACPIALWTGDLTAVECYVSTLLEHSTRHAGGLARVWPLPAGSTCRDARRCRQRIAAVARRLR